MVATPAPAAPAVLDAAGRLGCGGAVVLAAGFGETGDARAQDRCGRAAARACRSSARTATAGRRRRRPGARCGATRSTLPRPAAATIALVTQSGNLGVLALAHRAGLGLHTVVSLGNAASVDAAAVLDAPGGGTGGAGVAAYLEADGDGARTATALAALRGAGRAGRRPQGRAAAPRGAAVGGAHTASLSGDHAVFAALVARGGRRPRRRPRTTCSRRPGHSPAGRRDPRGCAVVTCSGGDAAVAADLAADVGVPLARWAPSTLAALDAALPATATATNPLDHTNLVWADPTALARIGAAVAADPGVGHALYVQDEPAGLSPPDAGEWAATRDGALGGLARAAATPLLVATTPGQEPPGGGRRPAAARCSRSPRCARPAPSTVRLRAVAAAAAAAAGRTGAGAPDGRWLAEHEAMPLLAAAGVAVPAHGVAATAAQAGAVAARLGVPVAVKLSAPGLLHASETGGVALGVEGAAAVEAVAAPAARDCRGCRAGARVLVAAMAPPGVEVLVCARADGVVPTLVVGLGGIWAEALADVVTLAAAGDARTPSGPGCRGCAAPALLTGGRGRPAVDVEALVTLACRVGDLLLGATTSLSVELNPVLVTAPACGGGRRPRALDGPRGTCLT